MFCMIAKLIDWFICCLHKLLIYYTIWKLICVFNLFIYLFICFRYVWSCRVRRFSSWSRCKSHILSIEVHFYTFTKNWNKGPVIYLFILCLFVCLVLLVVLKPYRRTLYDPNTQRMIITKSIFLCADIFYIIGIDVFIYLFIYYES